MSGDNNEDEDGFMIVNGKGNRKIHRRHINTIQTLHFMNKFKLNNREKRIVSLEEVENTLRRLNSIRNELQTANLYENAKNHIKETIQRHNCSAKEQKLIKIICIGLGSFCNLTSLHQLAFILQIQEDFSIDYIEFHDPIFNDFEKSLLNKIQCKVIEENYEGKYDLDTNYINLLYLPHCPNQLTNNLLWKNWNKMKLLKIILICNSVETLLKNLPESYLKRDAEYIVKISNYIEEYSLNNNYRYKDIFNDTSIHTLCENKLNDSDENFWSQIYDEPKYPRTELITKELEEKLKDDCEYLFF